MQSSYAVRGMSCSSKQGFQSVNLSLDDCSIKVGSLRGMNVYISIWFYSIPSCTPPLYLALTFLVLDFA